MARPGKKSGVGDGNLGMQLRDLVADKLAEKADERTRAASRARLQADALQALSDGLSVLDLWTRAAAGERRPRFTLADLAEAAVTIADAEGFPALSMRRLANELGVGTMTLYHYVRSKDELLALVVDTVMGELILTDGDELPPDWRPALTAIANRTRDTVLRHPWVFDIGDSAPIGPNAVRHLDQSLQAVAAIGLPLADRLAIVDIVDEFVFGYCLTARSKTREGDDTRAEMIQYLGALIGTGAYPTLAAIVEDIGTSGLWETVEASRSSAGRFQRHLDRLLDGIEADLDRRGHAQ